MSLTVEEALTPIEAIDASDQQNALAQEQLILELRGQGEFRGQYTKLEGGYQAPVHNRFPTLSYRATEFIAL